MKMVGLLLIACWFFVAEVSAAEPPNGGNFGDQGAAFSACQARGDWWLSNTRPSVPSAQYECRPDDQPPDAGVYRLWLSADMPFAPTSSFVYPLRNNCAARAPSTSGWSSLGNGASCQQGCAMGPATSSSTLTAGGKTYFSLAGAQPTGATCSYGDGSGEGIKDQDCVQAGTLTMCVRSDGKNCASASTGKQFCWSPGESGVKKADNNNQAATKSPANASINAPKDAPANGGDWTVTGQGSVSESKAGTTTTSNITTFDSSYGKDGTGKGDGTGSGTGGGGGDGDGEGDGEGEGDDEAGGVGEAPGDFYKPTELTVSSLMGEYYTKVSNTPVLASIKSFMVVNGGGSCPVFSMPATQWTPALSFDAHCSGTVYSVLQAMGWVLLAIVAFYAIQIAVT